MGRTQAVIKVFVREWLLHFGSSSTNCKTETYFKHRLKFVLECDTAKSIFSPGNLFNPLLVLGAL